MNTRSILLTFPLLLVGTVHAQTTIPQAFAGLEDFGEVPYVPGFSAGPNAPIDSPLVDADTRAYSTAFWQVVDNGGTDASPVTGFAWTAPAILALTSAAPAVDPDPWFGGLTLFEYVYGHRLHVPGGPETIEELIENDPGVATTWRHWTVYHQLATADSIDLEAHLRHAALVLDTLEPVPSTTVRGVPFFNGPLLISDRLEITDMSAWFDQDPGTSSPPVSSFQATGTQRVLDQAKGTLQDIPGLYVADGNAFQGTGTPGFDCDDFADAFGALIQKLDPMATATTVFCSWKTGATGGGNAKSRHLVTRITSGNEYWLCDAQTGGVVGPYNVEVQMDASPLLDRYDPVPGSTHTGQGQHDLGDRGWNEPPPWHESRDMIDHFGMKTMHLGLMTSCFIP